MLGTIHAVVRRVEVADQCAGDRSSQEPDEDVATAVVVDEEQRQARVAEAPGPGPGPGGPAVDPPAGLVSLDHRRLTEQFQEFIDDRGEELTTPAEVAEQAGSADGQSEEVVEQVASLAQGDAEVGSAVAGEQTGAREVNWVRARIGRVFGIIPPTPMSRWWSLIDAAFLAIHQPKTGDFLEIHPFAYTDTNGQAPGDHECFDTRTGLDFASSPPTAIKTCIADSFWSLLLDYPDDLATFADYAESESDDPDEDESYIRMDCGGMAIRTLSVHLPPRHNELRDDLGLVGDTWTCPDCDGAGLELVAGLLAQDCEMCRGTGVVA